MNEPSDANLFALIATAPSMSTLSLSSRRSRCRRPKPSGIRMREFASPPCLPRPRPRKCALECAADSPIPATNSLTDPQCSLTTSSTRRPSAAALSRALRKAFKRQLAPPSPTTGAEVEGTVCAFVAPSPRISGFSSLDATIFADRASSSLLFASATAPRPSSRLTVDLDASAAEKKSACSAGSSLTAADVAGALPPSSSSRRVPSSDSDSPDSRSSSRRFPPLRRRRLLELDFVRLLSRLSSLFVSLASENARPASMAPSRCVAAAGAERLRNITRVLRASSKYHVESVSDRRYSMLNLY